MKKFLTPALVTVAALVAIGSSSEPVKEESKPTTPVVAAVSADFYRQMAPERASRDRIRAAVDRYQAKQAKIAKARALAKKRAAELAKKRERARLAAVAAHNAAVKKAAERKNAQVVQSQKAYSKPVSNSYSGGSAKGYARSVLSASQFACLDLLFNRESGWNPHAMNPSSGAYGIPQALPGSKMASAGADWQTNPVTQVKWGLGYISSRYGTPCNAWSHSQSVGWY